MKNNELKMNLPSLDSLFTTQEERDNPKILEMAELPAKSIKDFPNHPFKVIDDEYMEDMVKSVKEYGVIMPTIVRKLDDGSYCMIAGHRRKHAAIKAGLQKIPCIVMKLNDDEATLLMVDTNIQQRVRLLASERAFAYKMKLDALKHQGKKVEETYRPLVEKIEKVLSAEIVGEETGTSGRTIQRYVRLTDLIPELLELVDREKSGTNNVMSNQTQNIEKENSNGISNAKKVFNVGKEFMNFGMYMAEGRNFNTNSKEQPQKRYYNRNNINNTRQEDVKKENNTIISMEADDVDE